MCIRDSGVLEQAREPFGVMHVHLTAVGADLVGTRRYRGSCLLYTSDAADERSSVDLGGRRIIKKKNKQRTTGWAT